MGGKAVRPPPVPAPQAIPEVGQDTGDMAMKKARNRSGFEKTIMTGALSPMSKGLKTSLG